MSNTKTTSGTSNKVIQGSRRLSKEEIAEVEDITEEEHFIPEWGGSVLLRSITQHQMNMIEKKASVGDEMDSEIMKRMLLVHGLADPGINDDDVDVWFSKSASAVSGILNKIMDSSRLSEDSLTKAEKRLPSGQ